MSLLGKKPVPWAAKTREHYERLIPKLRMVARKYGYALGVHGSLARDIDLIAAPWTREARSATALVEALMRASNSFIVKTGPLRCPERKPHGRLGWSLHLGGGPYIDLSVLPRRRYRARAK